VVADEMRRPRPLRAISIVQPRLTLWDAPRHDIHRPDICLVGRASRGIPHRVAQVKAPPSRLSLYGASPHHRSTESKNS
jgi:hypothetical protein